ncbi:MAG: DUF559 domain-containing protein [Thermoleophilaceae bacterium]|nr:DUF559 domain-containing protein [Thermoleophilaceae bacterium]
MPVTTPMRTLLDLAEVMHSDRALLRCVNQALVERLVTEIEIGERITTAVGRRGPPRLARLLRLGTGPARSTLESFAANAEVEVGGGRKVEVDFLFREQRLVVESDGDRFHSTRIQRREDAEKQAALELAGYRVIRISWEQATERPEETARRIRTALGQAASGS